MAIYQKKTYYLGYPIYDWAASYPVKVTDKGDKYATIDVSRPQIPEGLTWDPSNDAWLPGVTISSGGRYKNRIVLIGRKTVYFGDI